MVPVGDEHISQANAATGPQVKAIRNLGDNVVAPTTNDNEAVNGTSTNGITSDTNSSNPEFWIFEGVEEVFNLTKDFASTIGPVIAGPLGAVLLPTIIEGIKSAQPGDSNQVDLSAALRRALLANSTLLAAEQRAENSYPEGLFDTIRDFVNTLPFEGSGQIKPEDTFRVIGTPVIRLPFKEMMGAIGVATNAADQLVNDVAAELTRGLLLRAKIPSFAMQMSKPESAVEVGAPACSTNEKDFVEQLAEANSSKPEGFFGDVGNFFDGVASDVGFVVSDAARLVGGHVIGPVLGANKVLNDTVRFTGTGINNIFGTDVPVSGPIPQHMAVLLANALNVKKSVNKPEGAFDESKPESFFDTVLSVGKAIGGTIGDAMLTTAGPIVSLTGAKLPEGAFDELKPEAVFDIIKAGICKISQALILHSVIADQFLTVQMARPATELKAEGFFTDVGDFFSNNKNHIKTAVDIAGYAIPSFSGISPILGAALLNIL